LTTYGLQFFAFSTALAALPAPVLALDSIGCLIRPNDVIELSTPVAGIVSEVLVSRGDAVEIGQIIARLDNQVDALSLELAQARATDRSTIQARTSRVDFLELQANRLTALAERNAISIVVRDEAISEANVARFELAEAIALQEIAQIEVAREAALLEQKILRSPVAGIITEQLLSPGEYRDGQAHMATIATMDQLKIEAFAPLAYFGQFSVGDMAIIQPEAPIGGEYSAQITVIDQVFDAATATFGIELVIDNTGLAIPAGLRCSLEFLP